MVSIPIPAALTIAWRPSKRGGQEVHAEEGEKLPTCDFLLGSDFGVFVLFSHWVEGGRHVGRVVERNFKPG